MTQAYPLQWPAGLPRARSRRTSAFGEKTIGKATAFTLLQVRLMNGTLPILSTNLELRNDGLPYANQRQPADPAVALYFQRRGKPMVFACDQWLKVEHNIYAIGKTIEALRGIERWGSSDLMERAFTGFEALPAPEQWWQVLGVSQHASTTEIEAAYREKAKAAHPDTGGSTAAMARLNAARSQARAIAPQAFAALFYRPEREHDPLKVDGKMVVGFDGEYVMLFGGGRVAVSELKMKGGRLASPPRCP